MYTTVYTGGYTSALDFDYRYNNCAQLGKGNNYAGSMLCRRGYMFWSDTRSDRIYRAWLNGTGTTVLISSGLSNTCMMTDIIIQ